MTKGEKYIADLLTAAGWQYEMEKSFNDLRGGRYRFDFYIKLPSGEWVLCEYNGEQHYKPVPVFQKTRADFQHTQGHDRAKISWALAHNIKLYCIPYWELIKLQAAADIVQTCYLATTRYKNDDDWLAYQYIVKFDKS